MDSTPFFRGIAAALLAVLALLLTVSFAWGQTTGSAAVFEGRPALAGAQGGVGAQAGPPQGGIGVQGSDAAQVRLRGPGIVDTPRQQAQGLPGMPPGGTTVDRPSGSGVSPPRDPGVAKEQQSATSKVRRATKRAVEPTRKRPKSMESPLPGN